MRTVHKRGKTEIIMKIMMMIELEMCSVLDEEWVVSAHGISMVSTMSFMVRSGKSFIIVFYWRYFLSSWFTFWSILILYRHYHHHHPPCNVNNTLQLRVQLSLSVFMITFTIYLSTKFIFISNDDDNDDDTEYHHRHERQIIKLIAIIL